MVCRCGKFSAVGRNSEAYSASGDAPHEGGLRLRPIRPTTSLVAKEISPCFGFGPGIALIPLISPPSIRGGWRADKAHGLDRQARGWPDLQRALGVNVTPRALRRANAASSAYASISDRAAPGALCPWRVFPEAAREQDCVSACPQVPLPVPAFKTPHENALDDGSG
jgi:hypothetical protein